MSAPPVVWRNPAAVPAAGRGEVWLIAALL